MRPNKPFLGILLTVLPVFGSLTTHADDDPAAPPAQIAAAMEPDAWYPRERSGPKGRIVVYAPQLDTWDDFERISGWVAFQVTPTGSATSPYGSMRFQGKTEVDLETREVLLYDAEISELSIPNVPEGDEAYALIREAFTAQPTTVPLDLALEYMPDDIDLPSVQGLNPAAPQIFVATVPALLLHVESEALWVPIKDTSLEFVLNANWDLFREKNTERAYLRYDDKWLTAAALGSSWEWAISLPAELAKLPDDGNWAQVKPVLPADLAALPRPVTPLPRVFYATEPAELIQLQGQPNWTPLGDEGLEYAANTRQELLRLEARVYVLLSGRWFVAPGLDGPWEWTTSLPAPFANIPAAHEKGYLRASVPGTKEAKEAAAVATIPRQITVQRSAANLAPTVTYSGEPAFQPIEGTAIRMAVNTSYQVLEYQGIHYLCHNAIWFKSRSPNGPWALADSLPAEFANIPATSPAYNTTFVKIDSSDEDSVTYSYTPGYEQAYVVNNSVVYGTGYHEPVTTTYRWYPSGAYYWYDDYYYYPYYPYPPTYGYGSWYNPDTGRYGETVVAYGPYGAAATTAVFNPETGVYARGDAVWDSDEFAGRSYAYNPNTDTVTAGNRYVDFRDDEGWSQRVTTRGDEWRYKQSQWSDGRMVTEFESSLGTQGTVVRERQGDTLVSEGSITGEQRSAEFQSEWQDGSGQATVQGSEGGTGEFTREVEAGEITGTGTITKDGKTIETETRRTAEGVQRDFETSGGAQGTVVRQGDERAFVAETSGGDVYAGRDGNVYKKEGDSWTQVQNPDPDSRSASSQSRDNQLQRSTAGGDLRGGTDRDRQRSAPSYDRLDRDSRNRSRGYQRYGNHQRRMDRGFGGRGGGRRGGRRR